MVSRYVFLIMAYLKASFIINIVLILVVAIISFSAVRIVRNVLMTHEQSAEMTQKIEQLKTRKKELEAALVEIQTKEAVEREAKERLNLKSPGEQVVVVVPEKKDNAPLIHPMNFWDRIKFFFGK